MIARWAGHRLATGGLIDRNVVLTFEFNGKTYAGFAGDTLASALLANGVRIVGRSFKYHRPRGIVGAGVEEPNALVQLGTGKETTPNLRATEIFLFDGLVANSVNCWPSVRFDVGIINNFFSRFLPAGFYYKTFMWPTWHLYEWAIRRAAGLGKAPTDPDHTLYEARYDHCDVLVIGGGPAGLTAARAAALKGCRVMLVEQDRQLGGRLLWDETSVDSLPGRAWISGVNNSLADAEASVLTSTTAVGYFDHNSVLLIEQLDQGAEHNRSTFPQQRLRHVRAKRIILAAGALERPLVFAGNDRPGVMLSWAVRQYIGRFAVRPGNQAVVFTNNDDAYCTASAFANAGGKVAAIVDTRATPPSALLEQMALVKIPVFTGSSVVSTGGLRGLRSVSIEDRSGRHLTVKCDLLAISGGFNPTVQLFCQSGGRTEFDSDGALFKPSNSAQAEVSIGAAAGTLGLRQSLLDAHAAGLDAAARCGSRASRQGIFAPFAQGEAPTLQAKWMIGKARGKSFVDFQNDVTVDDIALSVREGFHSIEHLKRYTTLGMAPDQGKISNVNAAAIMSTMTDRGIEQVGTTKYRFPFIPVTFGALAGNIRGDAFRPIRRLPCHDEHIVANGRLEDYSGWLRPAFYPRESESLEEAVRREALCVRKSVGLFDSSSLGKIEIKGPDAAIFLDRVYANTISTLKPGRLRYGLMLNELGVIIDDGVAARLADDHFLVSTTSGGAGRIANWLEEWLQCEWPQLRVVVAPVTTSWAVLALSGPACRAVLNAVGTDVSLAPDDFPHMAYREGLVDGIAARLARVSYSGELTYEISVACSRAPALWRKLLDVGSRYGIQPVGVEACLRLRLEKGYLLVGADTDGTTNPIDVGWGHVLNRRDDFIGRRSLLRPNDRRDNRLELVGLEATDSKVLYNGTQLLSRNSSGRGPSEGYVTSSGYSPSLRRGVALAMLRSGRRRIGESVVALSDGRQVDARVTALTSYDPRGERIND